MRRILQHPKIVCGVKGSIICDIKERRIRKLLLDHFLNKNIPKNSEKQYDDEAQNIFFVIVQLCKFGLKNKGQYYIRFP